MRRLAALARERRMTITPPLVFEGNVPSDPAKNVALVEGLRRAYALSVTAGDAGLDAVDVTRSSTFSSPPSTLNTRHSTLPLGDSVEIGPPTTLAFERHPGSHLLLVGADSEAAYGVMATGLLALTAAHAIVADRSAISTV